MDPNVLRLAMGAAGAGGDEFQLFSWGYNGNGQLGSGTTTDRSSPVQVGALTNWSVISAGSNYCLAIKTDGSLWAWGNGGSGRLGDGTAVDKSSPIQIGSLTNWASVSAGNTHSLAVKTDGTLWAWGSNAQGELGDGTATGKSSPIQIGSLTNWSKVSAGRNSFSLAVKTNGTLWAWGNNLDGMLGDGTTTTRSSPVQIGSLTNWASVSACNAYSFGIKTDGTLWAWGNGSSYQLGLGNTNSYSSPVQVGSATNWRSISRDLQGYNSVIAVRTNNTAWSWGQNAFGELGLGDSGVVYSLPTQIGSLTNWSVVECDGPSAIGLKTDGTIWTWGYNYYGQLGSGTTTNRSSPVQVGALTTWQSVAAGRFAQYGTKKP